MLDGAASGRNSLTVGSINSWRNVRRRRAAMAASCCRQFVAFLFSQLGLASTVVAYSILGGFIFSALESSYEDTVRGTLNEDTVNDDTVRDTLTVFRRDRVDEIANLTAVFLARLGDVDRNWTTFNDEVGKVLVAFQKRVTQAIKDHGWDGRDDTDPDQWSFSASLLYAVTVITTIGYGHVAPKTNAGRFATMIYAVIGIPLTFLYLSTVGNYMASCFRIFYFRICCRCMSRCRSKSATSTATVQSSVDLSTSGLASAQQSTTTSRRKQLRRQVVELAAAGRRRLSTAIATTSIKTEVVDHRRRTPAAAAPTRRDSNRMRSWFADYCGSEMFAACSTRPLTRILDATSSCRCCARRSTQHDDETHHQNCSQLHHQHHQDEQQFLSAPSTSSTGKKQPSGRWRPRLALLVESAGSRWKLRRRSADEASRSLTENTSLTMTPTHRSDIADQYSRTQAEMQWPRQKSSKPDVANENQPETDSMGSMTSLFLELERHDTVDVAAGSVGARSTTRTGNTHAFARHASDLVGVAAVRLSEEACGRRGREAGSRDDGVAVDGARNSNLVGVTLKANSVKIRDTFQPRHRDRTTESSSLSSSNRSALVDKTTDRRIIEQPSSVVVQPVDELTSMRLEESPPPTDDSLHRRRTTFGIRCRSALCRCDSSGLAMKQHRERASLRDAAHAGIHPSTVADRLTSRTLAGRVGTVGIGAMRWAKTMKTRLTRIASRQRTIGDNDRTTNTNTSGRTDCRVAAAVSSPPQCAVHTDQTGSELDNDDADNDDDVAFDHVTRPSVSSDSFVTALDVTDWLSVNRRESCVVVCHEDCDNTDDDEQDDDDVIFDRCSSHEPEARHASFVGAVPSPVFGSAQNWSVKRSNTKISSSNTADSLCVDDSRKLKMDVADDNDDAPVSFRRSEVTTGSRRAVQVSDQRVPIYVCLIVIAVHISAGSVLFTLWEGWDLLTSFYFCFITLTTIGFGDIVPGTSADDWSSHDKLVLCALWLALGLSLIAMCFNLVQEQVRETCIRAARRCGLVKHVDVAN